MKQMNNSSNFLSLISVLMKRIKSQTMLKMKAVLLFIGVKER